MGLRLKQGESSTKGVRRIIAEEIDGAVRLAKPRSGATVTNVHEIRKSVKRIRALLRLVRKSLGEKTFRAENAVLRDIAGRLADARDAQIMVEAYEKLTCADGAEQPSREASIGRALRRNRDAMNALLVAKRALPALREELADCGARISRAASDGDGWSALDDGLRRAYGRGRRAFTTAYDTPSFEAFHEWRKRVKDLHLDIRVLAPLWPAAMEELARKTDTLSDLLGDDHDLGVLEGFLRSDARQHGGARRLSALFRAMERRRSELRKAARPIGDAVYGDSSKEFVKRLEALWHAW
jgi:CHAD domain-containing protein